MAEPNKLWTPTFIVLNLQFMLITCVTALFFPFHSYLEQLGLSQQQVEHGQLTQHAAGSRLQPFGQAHQRHRLACARLLLLRQGLQHAQRQRSQLDSTLAH